jgi:hypothetical protein
MATPSVQPLLTVTTPDKSASTENHSQYIISGFEQKMMNLLLSNRNFLS